MSMHLLTCFHGGRCAARGPWVSRVSCFRIGTWDELFLDWIYLSVHRGGAVCDLDTSKEAKSRCFTHVDDGS